MVGSARFGDFADFTEKAYVELITEAAGHYRFEPFGTTVTVPHVLWRHDIDFSVHRGLSLAKIEAELGVMATYFVLLHSPFYNAFELDVSDSLRQISGLGHSIGLHFESGYYGKIERETLEGRLALERRILEELLDVEVGVFSFHNPELDGSLSIDDDALGQMVSTYGRSLRNNYRYISDSNGIWRLEHLPAIVSDKGSSRLHVLTHPEWWTPEPMSPRDRVTRCIDGRSRRAHALYDELLERSGRPNVR